MHYWADLESLHGFRCYENIHVCKLIALYTANAYSAEREMSASTCARYMAGFVMSRPLCVVGVHFTCIRSVPISVCLSIRPSQGGVRMFYQHGWIYIASLDGVCLGEILS